MPRGIYDRTPKPTIEQGPSIYAAIVLPKDGELLLKILDGPCKVAFTVAISRTGVSYAANNAKKQSTAISWGTLEALSKAGFIALNR